MRLVINVKLHIFCKTEVFFQRKAAYLLKTKSCFASDIKSKLNFFCKHLFEQKIYVNELQSRGGQLIWLGGHFEKAALSGGP